MHVNLHMYVYFQIYFMNCVCKNKRIGRVYQKWPQFYIPPPVHHSVCPPTTPGQRRCFGRWCLFFNAPQPPPPLSNDVQPTPGNIFQIREMVNCLRQPLLCHMNISTFVVGGFFFAFLPVPLEEKSTPPLNCVFF